MAKLPSLSDNAHLSELFRLFPQSTPTLMAYTDVVMRGPGDIPVAERELIAAYVSGLNRCTFCLGSHRIYARAFGIDEDMLEAALDDLESAPLPKKTRALLRYVAAVNTLPARISQAQMDAVLAAGWSEQALFEAVQIAGLFAMMNRIVEGTGVSYDYTVDETIHPANRLGERAREHSYVATPMGRPDKA